MPCNHHRTCDECRAERRRRGKTIARLWWSVHVLHDMLQDVEHPALVEAPLNMNADSIQAFVDGVLEHAGVATNRDVPTGCSICFNDYDNGQHTLIAMQCGHHVCASCMRQLTEFKCPICRERISRVFRLFNA